MSARRRRGGASGAKGAIAAQGARAGSHAPARPVGAGHGSGERGSAAPPGATGLPLSHPALWLAALAAAACVVISVGFPIWETDVWQHLLVGKAIWTLGRVPVTNLWSWPTYGAPDVNPSWGFSALIWPVWQAGGLAGLFAWRWVTSLAAFALLWLAARRMGARGVLPFAVVALAALTWRYRSQVRPETLTAVLIALQIWILETRRHGGRDLAPALIPLQWLWANTHLSSYLGVLMIGAHVVGDAIDARRRRAGGGSGRPAAAGPGEPGRLALIGLAAVGLSLVNPYGWRALAQPFEYALFWRHEAIYRAIPELLPLLPDLWRAKLWTGLPLLIVLWPVLALVRWRRRGADPVELIVCTAYTAMTLASVRFAGFYALVMVPYLSRDLADATRDLPRLRLRPQPWAPAVLGAAACVALSWPEWSRQQPLFGIGMAERRVPAAACDFMAAERVRGHGFQPFYFAGWLLWRFWPEMDRLPFMDIHQSGTPEIRDAYVRAFTQPGGWRALDDRWRFDWVLLDAAQSAEARDPLRDVLDRDERFALVFRDDAAVLYVRREGTQAPLAERLGARCVPGGDALLPAFGRAAQADTAFRAAARAELARHIAASPWNADARSLMANLDFLDGDLPAAKIQLERALDVDPSLPGAHERLALIAMQQGRPGDAVRELEAELEQGPGSPLLARRLADAYARTGQRDKAREWYGRAGLTSPPPGGESDSTR